MQERGRESWNFTVNYPVFKPLPYASMSDRKLKAGPLPNLPRDKRTPIATYLGGKDISPMIGLFKGLRRIYVARDLEQCRGPILGTGRNQDSDRPASPPSPPQGPPEARPVPSTFVSRLARWYVGRVRRHFKTSTEFRSILRLKAPSAFVSRLARWYVGRIRRHPRHIGEG